MIPKESKEELKMKNKNIVKKVAVASLAALISVPNIITPTTVQAAYNQVDQATGVGSGKVVSAVNQGQYTLVNDDWGCSYLVNSNQWQEYQLLLQQGSPEVVLVITTDFDGDFHTIDSYQLKGQPEVKLPKNSCIKVNDPYNCDQLTVLKHIGNQLGTSYLYNQQKWFDDINKKNQQIYADIAKQQAQQQAENQRSAEESARNTQINAEMDVYSNNYGKNHNSSLPYTVDYLKNYRDSQAEIAHQKVWSSFDNERNYIQQWLTAHGFKSMQELKDYAYKTGVTHYGLQEQVAIQYCKYVEEGKCSTIGDYIRLKFKENPMAEWNQLAKWADTYLSIDFDLDTINRSTKYIPYVDIYRINLEVCKMIEADMPIIANYSHLTKEQKTSMIDTLLNSGTLLNGTSTGKLSKEHVSNFETSGELRQKIMNKWNTEYLPNIRDN